MKLFWKELTIVWAAGAAAVDGDGQLHRSLVTIATEFIDSSITRASAGSTLTLLPGTYTGEMSTATSIIQQVF